MRQPGKPKNIREENPTMPDNSPARVLRRQRAKSLQAAPAPQQKPQLPPPLLDNNAMLRRILRDNPLLSESEARQMLSAIGAL